jgi:hypothetical protein
MPASFAIAPEKFRKVGLLVSDYEVLRGFYED